MQFDTSEPAFWAIILLTFIAALCIALPEEFSSTYPTLLLLTTSGTAGLFLAFVAPMLESSAARYRELELTLTDARQEHKKEVEFLANDVSKARAEVQKSLDRCYRVEKERDRAVREKDEVMRKAKETTSAWRLTKMEREKIAAEEQRKEEARRRAEKQEQKRNEEEQNLLGGKPQASEGAVTVSTGGEQLAAAYGKLEDEFRKMKAELEETKARQRNTMASLGDERKARVIEQKTHEKETHTLTVKLRTAEQTLTSTSGDLSAATFKIAELERKAADDALERSRLQSMRCSTMRRWWQMRSSGGCCN